MLWNTLIIKVVTWVDAHPTDPGAQTITLQAQEAGKTVHGYLKDMDIRKVGALRALVPQAFPRTLRNPDKRMQLTENIHGKWRVDLQK